MIGARVDHSRAGGTTTARTRRSRRPHPFVGGSPPSTLQALVRSFVPPKTRNCRAMTQAASTRSAHPALTCARHRAGHQENLFIPCFQRLPTSRGVSFAAQVLRRLARVRCGEGRWMD